MPETEKSSLNASRSAPRLVSGGGVGVGVGEGLGEGLGVGVGRGVAVGLGVGRGVGVGVGVGRGVAVGLGVATGSSKVGDADWAATGADASGIETAITRARLAPRATRSRRVIDGSCIPGCLLSVAADVSFDSPARR
jgi:hypothetical protein